MKALFGVVSLLVALAIVGLVAVRQLKAVGRVGSPASPIVDSPAAPQLSGGGTVAQQSRDLQKKVTDDVARAMNQAAETRRADPEKP